MSALVDRIAEVLKAELPESLDVWTERVAEQIAEALQPDLKQAWQDGYQVGSLPLREQGE